ncbi:hypothetical protein ACQY0O_007747 [Thecaphora frezii]
MTATTSIDLSSPSPPSGDATHLDTSAAQDTRSTQTSRSSSILTPPPASASASALASGSRLGSISRDSDGGLAPASGTDILEEVDDPSELLARPLERPSPPLLRPDPPLRPPASLPGAGSAKRTLPSGFGARSSNGTAAHPSSLGASSAARSGSASGASRAGTGRIWQPPSKRSVDPEAGGFVISGSGARVPTTFLDASGGYSREAAEALRDRQQQPQPPAHPLAAPGRGGSGSAGQVPILRPASASSGSVPGAIDLTGDDDDDEVVASRGPTPARKKSVDRVVIDDDDDDEPVIVSSRMAEEEVVLDEKRNHAIVCLGMINSVVLCMYGLPQQLTFDGGYGAQPPADPAYDRSQWPGMSSFWAEKGYRPVMLSLSNPNAIISAAGRTLPNGWGVNGAPVRPPEIKVSAVLPPLLAHPSLSPEDAIKAGPRYMPPFGSLAEKYNNAMEPLLKANKIRCEARCRMVNSGRANGFLHSIEILVFGRRPDVALVSDKLSTHGVQLDHPTTYRPEDYPTSPEYSNPHNPPPGGYRSEPRAAISGLYRGSGMGVTMQTREATEQQKKEQVDAIYSSITSGEELETVEPTSLVRTPLFQHQKQALSFLLQREQPRRWSELKLRAEENGASEAQAEGPRAVAMTSKAARKEARTAKNLANSISLWKVNWDSTGKVRSFVNLITQREAKRTPTICRGAILADDMGLGKTITTIALIAHTREEAEAFGQSDLASYPPPPESDVESGSTSKASNGHDDGADEVTIDDFASSLVGAPPPSKRTKRARSSPKRKISRSKGDPEAVRQEHLECRSRATLIVCPLSVVANWEEQIREHWGQKRPPRIYVYHGNSRITDTVILSNHDIVLTTYPTLGHEFSNQNTWIDGTDKKAGASPGEGNGGPEEGDDDDDDNEAVIMVNENGIPIESEKKGGKKRKKRSEPGKESPNALQRIEWFRVVLDEAHYIKGPQTWQSRAVCNLSAQRRLCLTGTPIQNSTDDLYALIKFLRLDPFTDRAIWNEFCGNKDTVPALRRGKMGRDGGEPIDSASLGHIQIIMKFLALRRTKATKSADGSSILSLPPKCSKVELLEFDESERVKYHTLHNRYKEDFEEMLRDDTVSNNYATILHEILNLRMSCDHPSLVDASKDARRKLSGLDDGPALAISQDGLSRERAVALFGLYRETEMAYCVECQCDLSQPVADRDGLGSNGGIDALDDALQAAVVEQDRRGNSHSNSNGNGSGNGSGKGKASAPQSADLLTPASFEDGSNMATVLVRPVVTRCQHVVCSTCFRKHVGDAWPRPKAADMHYCPSCRTSLRLAIDAIQLEPSDLADLDAAAETSEDEEEGVKDDDDDDDDGLDAMETKEVDQAEAAAAATKAATSEGEGSETEDEAKRELAPPRRSKRSVAAREAKKAKPAVRGDASLQGRTDLSTKIRALLSDLIPFSKCNPHSALYDPDAPVLEHADPKTAEDEEAKQSTESVVVVQKPPSAAAAADFRPVKSVVFSQWTKMLDRIAKSLKLTGIQFARLDGAMRRNERSAALDRFKCDAATEVLLISLRAGGTGLNLVGACRAYLMDPYWNPAVENQGLDRVHRMGQQRPVITIKYIMKNSIEENMLELQKRKMQLADKVGERRKVGGAAAAVREQATSSAAERREELRLLFS